jgi:hypothetical protein
MTAPKQADIKPPKRIKLRKKIKKRLVRNTESLWYKAAQALRNSHSQIWNYFLFVGNVFIHLNS